MDCESIVNVKHRWSSFLLGLLLYVLEFATYNCFLLVHLSGPTSFAPVIEMGITIVEQSGGQYHVLLIIADGQVLISRFWIISVPTYHFKSILYFLPCMIFVCLSTFVV